MRSLHAAFTSFLIVISSAGVAWAQFGMCGSPELVQIPKRQQPLLPQYTYANAQQSYTYVQPNAIYGSPTPPSPPAPEGVQPIPADANQTQPNMVGSMLSENSGYSGCNQSCGQYGACDGYTASGCGDCMTNCCEPCCPWYASVTALMMTRNRPNGIWTTYESADLTNQMMKSDFDMKWQPGGEIRFGRRFCCNAWAAEFVFWSLAPFEGMDTASVIGGTVSSTLEVAEVEFPGSPTVNAAAIFNNSAEQKLWRTDETYNFEINLLRGSFCDNGGWPWDTQWIMGFRYFRFRDRLIYGAVANNNDWGSDGGIHEAYVNDHARNNLFAFQFGFESRTARRHNLQAFLSPKIAVGCNHIENEYQIYRGDGVVGRPTAASGMVGEFPITSTKDVFSLITQIDIGLDWQFAPKWSARIGYRVMVATGMGLADNQIPFYIVDIPEVQNIDHNAELILHGGFAGITYSF